MTTAWHDNEWFAERGWPPPATEITARNETVDALDKFTAPRKLASLKKAAEKARARAAGADGA
jgi:hypothetical protein